MMRVIRAVALSILPLVAISAIGSAQLITSAGQIPASSQQVDLSAYYNSTWTHTAGPLLFNGGSIAWQSTAVSVIGNATYGLGGNGIWNSSIPSAAIGLDVSTGSYTFTFTNPVSFFSAFMNYATGFSFDHVFLTALGVGGTVLNSYDITTLAPISGGGTNNGAVRGISHSSADIFAVRFSNSYVIGRDFRFVASDAVIGTVPEPSSMALVATGLFGLAGVVRRRRNSN